MHPVFAILLETAKTSKFQPVKPKRTIVKKQPLLPPGTATAAPVARWDEPTDNYYFLRKGELLYKRNGVVVHGVTGCDRWA